MMKGKQSALMMSAVLVALTVAAQPRPTGDQSPQAREAIGVRPFEKATELEATDGMSPAGFEFSLDTHSYSIDRDGRGKRKDGERNARSFRVRLESHDHIEHVFYAEYQDDLLLVCEVSDDEAGAGFITRLDGRTLRAKWRRWIPGFNVGQGLIEGDHAYLTAIGFVGKVELRRGAYIWRHEDLYQDGSFNFFELPRLTGDTVLFKEETIYSEPAKTISVDKRSGKILSNGR